MVIYVFNEQLQRIGLLNLYTALQWNEVWGDSGSFQLWAIFNRENSQLLVSNNLIWTEEEQLGVIEVVKKSIDDDGRASIVVSGRFVESKWLGKRIIWGKQVEIDQFPSDIVRSLVTNQAISPADPSRTLSNIVLDPNPEALGEKVSMTRSFSNLWVTIREVCSIDSLDTRLRFNPIESKLYLTVKQGTDRSNSVRISTELNDILTSDYKEDSSNFMNTALVAGRGEDSDRKIVYLNNSNSGLGRNELYVDARDLSETDQKGFALDPQVYLDMLYSRGKSRLDEFPTYSEYNTTIRTKGKTAYIFGVDYFLGDTITIVDNKIGVTLKAQVKGRQRYYDEKGESVNLTIGIALPTITQLLKGR